MGFGFIGIVLMLVVAVVLIRALFPQASRFDEAGTPQVHRESALDTARRRYAAGEIDRRELEVIKRELSETGGLEKGV